MIYLSFQQKTIIFTFITAVFLMLFFLSRSLYYSYQIDEQANNFSSQNKVLSQKIEAIKLDLDYYNSVSYKDKYAKEMLNMLNPGEKVLIFNESEINNSNNQTNSSVSTGKKTAPEAWQEYFNFNRKINLLP